MRHSVAGRRTLVALLAAGTVGLAACTGVATPGTASGSSSPVATIAPPSPGAGRYDVNTDPVVQAIRVVEPAVVNVTTNVVESDPFGGSQIGKGIGTGFVVRSNGIVVTNFHVVEGGVWIRVTFNDTASGGIGGKSFAARVIGGDNNRDLAVLQLEGVTRYEPLPTVPLGNSDRAVVGERVVAIGYALALIKGGPTVTSGILSSTARTIQAQDPQASGGTRTYEDALQTDAAINPGNSGGPLIDLNGNVIGINTAGNNSAQSIGFAIAINGVKSVIDQAIAHPSAPVAYLGVSSSPVAVGSAATHGALVVALSPGGPAAVAGIKAGEIITAFGGKSVSGPDDLGTDIAARRPGDRVAVEVVDASGHSRTVTVTLGTRPLPKS